jgi:energy-converting hydrogenase Eha subunit E
MPGEVFTPMWGSLAAGWCGELAFYAQAALVIWVGWVMYGLKYKDPLKRPLAVALTMGGAAIGVALVNLAINGSIFLYLLSQVKYSNSAPFW